MTATIAIAAMPIDPACRPGWIGDRTHLDDPRLVARMPSPPEPEPPEPLPPEPPGRRPTRASSRLSPIRPAGPRPLRASARTRRPLRPAPSHSRPFRPEPDARPVAIRPSPLHRSEAAAGPVATSLAARRQR